MVDLNERIPNSVFVFRGYTVTNLGRSPELLAHRAYGAIVERTLQEAVRNCQRFAVAQDRFGGAGAAEARNGLGILC